MCSLLDFIANKLKVVDKKVVEGDLVNIARVASQKRKAAIRRVKIFLKFKFLFSLFRGTLEKHDFT